MAPLHLNPTSFLLLASTLLFLFFILKPKLKSKLPSINLPPGPKPLPLIGNLHHLGDQPHLALQRLSCTYGPIFRLTLGFIPTVVVSSAKLAREVGPSSRLHAVYSMAALIWCSHLMARTGGT
ncbi:Cytochrome P450 [Rhynchospora pubera]|uniref:Cytochrome P450 n=1 Tax=Rhynchospora pubera TaxID=906938 RepID=A0AAV8DBJ5_9POAL|nr:Cytochrome P450 [Rhynchospora pubera]